MGRVGYAGVSRRNGTRPRRTRQGRRTTGTYLPQTVVFELALDHGRVLRVNADKGCKELRVLLYVARAHKPAEKDDGVG
jgi:hypothetical protein